MPYVMIYMGIRDKQGYIGNANTNLQSPIVVIVLLITTFPLLSIGPYGAKATSFTLALYIIVPATLSKTALVSSIVTEPPERPPAINASEPTEIRALGLRKVTLVRGEHSRKTSDSSRDREEVVEVEKES